MNDNNKSFMIKLMLGLLAGIVILGLICGKFDNFNFDETVKMSAPLIVFIVPGLIITLFYYKRKRE